MVSETSEILSNRDRFLTETAPNRMGTYVPHLNGVFCSYQAHIAFG